MNYWDSVGRWINTLLLFIVGIISFDTLFRLLEAQESNVIVGVTRLLAAIFLVPFRGMFGDQEFVQTTLIAILGYAMLVGITLSVLRGLQASRVAPRMRDDRQYPQQGGPPPQRPPAPRAANRRPEPQSGRAPTRRPSSGRAAGGNRNGRAAGPAAKGATRVPDGAARTPDGARPSTVEGTTPRGVDRAPARGSDATPPRAGEAAGRPAGPKAPRPNRAPADAATTRKVDASEPDGSDE
jgi:hypothetical protein